MNLSYRPRISRRTTLQWLTAAIAGSGLPVYSLSAVIDVPTEPAPVGYGIDPDLRNPVVPWSRTMTAYQLQMTAALADLILPATETAPSPSELGIPDFIDEWVSAPYPRQRADRKVIFDGIAAMDAAATKEWRTGFLQIGVQKQQQIVEAFIPGNSKVEVGNEAFFSRFRCVVVGAYYTTPEGFRDIGYIGNVPLRAYPPVTEEECKLLDAELRKLGI